MAVCNSVESTKGVGHVTVRNILIGLVAVRALYQVAYPGGWTGSSRPVWQSDDDGFETLTNEAPGLETLANEVDDEGECLESKMFEMWSKEAEAEKDLLRKVEEHPAFAEAQMQDGTASTMDQHIVELKEDFDGVLERLSASRGRSSGASATAGEAADADRDNRRRERQAEFDRLFEETQKAIRERKSSVPQWSDIQSKLQSQYDSAAAARQQAALAHQREFDKLYQDAQAHLNSEGGVSNWAQELQRSQARMQERLQQLHAAHQGGAQPSSLRGARTEGGATSWAQGLMDMQAKLQHQLEHLHDHHHHHSHDGSAGGAAPRGPPTAWAQGLLDMQAKMQHELDHLHDHHHHHPDAPQGASSSEPSTEWAQGLAKMQAEMQYHMDHLHDHLHSHQHASTEGGPEKVASRLRGGSRVAPAAEFAAKPADKAILEWLPVRSWRERAPVRGAQALTLNRDGLGLAAWSGDAPNVSCIMALPATATAQFHLMYAVNNFKLQRYDGDSELVVVYHHDDAEGAKLVRKYMQEGARVRGVASRDDVGSFPSTMAFRYAAWTSRAQVIAQWDFEAYHHPERLSMQVRAMATSRRPGSLLLDDAAQQPDAAGAPAHGREGSLVGEAAWMRQHWHPLLDEEHGVLELAQAHNVVLVDSPAYLYGTGAAGHPHESNSDASGSAQVQDELELRGIEACRSLGSGAAAQTPEPTLEQALEDVGAEAGELPRLLERRRDVAAKFGALCAEAEDEVDTKKRSFLHHHAGQMDTVREHLDEHFAKVQVMLEVF